VLIFGPLIGVPAGVRLHVLIICCGMLLVHCTPLLLMQKLAPCCTACVPMWSMLPHPGKPATYSQRPPHSLAAILMYGVRTPDSVNTAMRLRKWSAWVSAVPHRCVRVTTASWHAAAAWADHTGTKAVA